MKIGIAGTGPAALMAGSQCVLQGHTVFFYEQKKAAGRKFLVAGHGGFNLSHSEAAELFLSRYSGPEIRRYIAQFDNQALVQWLQVIGIQTYTGSTGKIFPVKGTKPIQVLQSWIDWLTCRGATFHYEHRLTGFTNDSLTLEHAGRTLELPFDRIVLALGGGSWAKTGSDAAWVSLFRERDIAVRPLAASNAGMNFTFPADISAHAGTVLKNVVVSHGDQHKAGEITLTDYGLEGAPIYYLNASYRQRPELPLLIDLKPQWTLEKLIADFREAGQAGTALKNAKLPKAAIWLLKNHLSKAQYTDPEQLAAAVKGLAVFADSLRDIEEAISTSGGVSWEEVLPDLSLRKFPQVFVCGEMLDWDAPTGGYLLQGCFATGFAVGNR
jgi:uncharacterized flavoprotein (TIGR03862 family)